MNERGPEDKARGYGVPRRGPIRLSAKATVPVPARRTFVLPRLAILIGRTHPRVNVTPRICSESRRRSETSGLIDGTFSSPAKPAVVHQETPAGRECRCEAIGVSSRKFITCVAIIYRNRSRRNRGGKFSGTNFRMRDDSGNSGERSRLKIICWLDSNAGTSVHRVSDLCRHQSSDNIECTRAGANRIGITRLSGNRKTRGDLLRRSEEP